MEKLAVKKLATIFGIFIFITGAMSMNTVSASGWVYDTSGNEQGWWGDDGWVYNTSGNEIGWVGTDGWVYDTSGNETGWMGTDGWAYNTSGNEVGWIEGADRGRKGGAALMLFLR